MKRGKKIALIAGAASLALFTAISIGLYLWLQDEPPPNVADLQVARLNLPDSENALGLLKQAAKEVYEPASAHSRFLNSQDNGQNWPYMLTGEVAWDETFVAELLSKNEAALKHFDEAVAIGRMELPELKSLFDGETVYKDIPKLREMVLLSRLKLLKAMQYQRIGRNKEALDCVCDVLKMGLMYEKAGGGTGPCFLGTSLRRLGLSSLRKLVGESSVQAELLLPYTAEIRTFETDATAWANAYRSEYWLDSAIVDSMKAGAYPKEFGSFSKVKIAYLLKPNLTKRLMADYIRAAIQKITILPAEWKNTYSKEINMVLSGKMSRWDIFLTSGNQYGRILLVLAIKDYDSITLSKYNLDFEIRATAALIAVECYRRHHGTLPQSLEELVPAYLPEITVDPFDGKPLGYFPEMREIRTRFIAPREGKPYVVALPAASAAK